MSSLVPRKPYQIKSPLHEHPLTLPYGEGFRCDACFQRCLGADVGYCCSDCNFNLDLKCANDCASIRLATDQIKESQAIDEELVMSFPHSHPLQLYENIPVDRLECGICGNYCSHLAYCCFRCSLFLHPSCSTRTVPQQFISYPFHPEHDLILLDLYAPGKWSIQERECNACKKYIHGLTYACRICKFYLHFKCGTVIKSSIDFEGHGHLLHFWDDIQKYQLTCSACSHNILESYGFTCLNCDFNLHLTCGPLPYTIQHECHIDPLVLTDSPVEEEVEDATDEEEFYCHACEEERDPQLPVYYCAECQFIAEIKCVMTQVISLLKGESDGDLELRNVLGQPGNLISANVVEEILQKKLEQMKPTTLCDIVDSFNQEEKTELYYALMAKETITDRKNVVEEILQKKFEQMKPTTLFDTVDSFNEEKKIELYYALMAKETITARKDDSHEYRKSLEFSPFYINDYVQYVKDQVAGGSMTIKLETFLKSSEDFLLSDNAWMQFRDILNSGRIIPKPWENREEVVNVGIYMVPRRLAPILKHLLSKHGDVSARSMLSPRVKLVFFNILCECIYGMKKTKVVDVKEDLLSNWWASFKILQFARFEILFAFNHLERVAKAYLGHFVKEKVTIALNGIDRDIAMHYRDIEALQEKVKRIESAKCAKSRLIEECFREALILKYWKVGTGLL